MPPRAMIAAAIGFAALAAAAPAQEVTPEQAAIDYANGLFARTFFAEAIDEYGRYIEAYPAGAHAVEALLRRGQAALAIGRHDAAAESFSTALARDLDAAARLEAQAGAGEALFFLGRYDEAAAQLEPLIKPETAPELRARALYFLGKTRYAQQFPLQAIEAFEQIAEGLPDSPLRPYAQFQLGHVYLAQRDLENAATAFSAVATSNAAAELRAECRFRAAEVYGLLGWHEAALGAYEALRGEFPDSPFAAQSAYGYAWALYRAAQYDKALAAADAALGGADAETRPALLLLRANALQQLSRHDEALAAFEALRKEHPGSSHAAQAQYKLAWVHQARGDTAAARREAAAFVETHPDAPEAGDAAYLLGALLLAEGNYETAQQQFRLVAEKFPDSAFGPEALYKAAECQAQLGLRAEAAAAFADFAKRYPDHTLAVQAILRAGDARFEAGGFDDAAAQYAAMLEKPLDTALREGVLYRMAVAQHNAGDAASSAASFAKLLSEFPASAHVAEAHFRTAEHALREGNDALAAIAGYQAALDAAPQGPFAGMALRGMAVARFERNDLDQAAALFLRCVREFPGLPLNEESYAWAGQYLFDAQRWDDAALVLETMAARIGDYPYPERVRFTIGECREKAGQLEAALAAYQGAIDAAPTSSKALEARFRMAAIREQQGDLDGAMQLYEQAANANNGQFAAEAAFRLGELLEKKGDPGRAARSFMRIAILYLHEDLSPEALWRAGACFEQAGKPDQARKAYAEIVADYPAHARAAEAQAALARLGQG